MHHHNYQTVNNDIIGQLYMWWIQTYITIIIEYIILSIGALQYIHGCMDWRGYATTNNNNNTARKICNTHPSTNALSPSYIIYYIHGNTIINILILQIVCMLHKSHHCIIYELGGKHITTNISQTIHNHNSRSRDLSPGITTAFIWCFMPTKFTPHYSGHIITLWRYMWCIQKSIHPAWGYSILQHNTPTE